MKQSGSGPAFSAADFTAATGITGERLARLEKYRALLVKWNPAINLVGPATLAEAWQRHFLDSAQLLPLLPPPPAILIDLGSGAGFPGLVLACLSALEVHLVESDRRKAAFLSEVARSLDVRVHIHAQRIDEAVLPPADRVTARALAPLNQLLTWAQPLLKPTGRCLFLKGARSPGELTDAAKSWHMGVTTHRSQTDPGGVVLELENVRRVSES